MSTLIFDRTQADTDRAAYLIGKIQRREMLTEAEQAEYNAGLRGCYNITDLNRVEAKVRELAETLRSYGYSVDYTVPMKGASVLPSGYTEVEYIQSSGTQYIDTGVVANTLTSVAMNFEWLGTNTAWMTVFGSYDSNNYFSLWHQNTSDFQAYMGTSNYAITDSSKNISLELSATKFKINSTERTFSTTIAASSNLYLFHISNGQDSYAKAVMRLYSCVIYNGDTPIRKFIPCKNPAGTVGLYDRVGGEFYTTPTAAGAVALPTGYTQVEYIQSSGTQYIDTGFKPDQNTMIEADIAYLGTAGDNIAGVRNSSSDAINRFGLTTFGSAKKIGAFFRDSSIQAITLDNKKHKYNLSKNGLYVDSILYGSSNSGSFACSYNYILFGFNNGSNGIVYTKSRVYACKIYNSGTLVRNLIPAKNSSGVIGLYDLVNSAFYTNAGSGTFTAGADIVGFTAGAEVGKAEDREWQYTDTMLESDVLLYLANIAALRDVIQLPPDIPPIPTIDRWIDWMAANDIERIVYELDRMIYGIVPLFRRCGTFRAGKNVQHLLLAKGVN